MVLADPGFLVAQAVQVLQQFKIAVKGFSWILVERMEGRQEDAIAHRNCAGHWSDASFRLPILGSDRISHYQSEQLPPQGWIIALPLQGTGQIHHGAKFAGPAVYHAYPPTAAGSQT